MGSHSDTQLQVVLVLITRDCMLAHTLCTGEKQSLYWYGQMMVV